METDIRHGSTDEDNDDEVDPFGGGDDDQDGDYLTEENASDIDQEEIIEQNKILDSNEEIEDDLLNESTAAPEPSAHDQFFHGRDGTKWMKDEPPADIRIRQHSIMRLRSGSRNQNSVPIEVFKKFFTPCPITITVPENIVVNQPTGADTLAAKRVSRLYLQGGEKLRRKTSFYCIVCKNPVCQQHSKITYTCFACLPPNL